MPSARLFRRIPWSVVVWTFGLMAIGLAAIARGDELEASGELWPRQLVWIALAVAAMFAGTVRHYRVLRDVSYPLFFGCLVLLGLVYLTPAKNGSHRWIPLGLFDFQPSELTKLAFIIALSNYLIHRRNYRELKRVAGSVRHRARSGRVDSSRTGPGNVAGLSSRVVFHALRRRRGPAT